MIECVPKCLHKSVWTKQDRINYLVSDVAPSGAEAMAILLVINNQPKWIWQAGVEKVHGQVGVYHKKLIEEGKTMKTLEDNEKEPLPLYSDSHCGANKCGGWTEKGKAEFLELKQMIDEARALDTTKEIEEQLRLELQREYEEANKTSEDEEESAGGSDDDDSEDDGDVDPKGYESCDSATVLKKLLKTQWVEKKPAAASNSNGDASSSEAATSSSNNKEDDTSSNNNNKDDNKKDQPPKPQEQQQVVPPSGEEKKDEEEVPPPEEEKDEKKEEETAEGAEATNNKPKKKKGKTPLAPRVKHPRGAKSGSNGGK